MMPCNAPAMSIPSLSFNPRVTASRHTSEKSFFSARARRVSVAFNARVILTVLITVWPCMGVAIRPRILASSARPNGQHPTPNAEHRSVPPPRFDRSSPGCRPIAIASSRRLKSSRRPQRNCPKFARQADRVRPASFISARASSRRPSPSSTRPSHWCALASLGFSSIARLNSRSAAVKFPAIHSALPSDAWASGKSGSRASAWRIWSRIRPNSGERR